MEGGWGIFIPKHRVKRCGFIHFLPVYLPNAREGTTKKIEKRK